MPEIKHTFTAGKMNKDFDERLVQNGEYRDALNIQVKTTDLEGEGGSSHGNIGVVQNLLGNSEIGIIEHAHTTTNATDQVPIKCVGSVADEKNDKAYFFFSNGYSHGSQIDSTSSGYKVWYDSIIEQDVISGTTLPVVIDRHSVVANFATVMGSSYQNPLDSNGDGVNDLSGYTQITVADGSQYRAGMWIQLVGSLSSDMLPGAVIKRISGNVITLTTRQTNNIATGQYFIFRHPRVLEFNPNRKITGINIIDDLLFWTDGHTEPKRINIKKCKKGSVNFTTHTKLAVDDPTNQEWDDIVNVSEVESGTDMLFDDLQPEHVTVIRSAPTSPPSIHINSRNELVPIVNATVIFAYVDANTNGVFINGPGTIMDTQDTDYSSSTYLVDDTLVFTLLSDEEIVVEARFISYVEAGGNETIDPTDIIRIEITDVLGEVNQNTTSWSVQVKAKKDKPLFELKFPRFAYRYKYDNGEYSAFSPWSSIAFEPNVFDYSPKKGYNLGMVNNITELALRDFIPPYTARPLDVSGVDILVKSTDDANVYVLKTISRGIDPEWDLFESGTIGGSFQTGELIITSEMIHSALSSNQLLRGWDNVPKRALAQEIIGNRLVYGNYTQGYSHNYNFSLSPVIKSEDTASLNSPEKSVKSLRNYKIGAVFSDKYGRETPVFTSTYITGDNTDNYTASSSDIIVGKELCNKTNKISVKQAWGDPSNIATTKPMDWMESIKYYVKETSSEYYNLVMDRWYYAEEQENLWISFPSADRNKVDEETYLILKNAHGNNEAVLDKGRFKIIAIENDAPDFIKIDRRVLGRVRIQDSALFASNIVNTASTTTNATQPGALLGSTSINIVEQNWNNFLTDHEEKGTLKFRMVGVLGTSELYSGDYKTIDYHKKDSSGNCVLRWRGALDNSVDFQERFTANSGFTDGGYNTNSDDLEYYMEIVEDVVENKPEFDGRFFVLVEKDTSGDNVISKHIETLSDINITWAEDTIYQLAYVSAQSSHPSDFGTQSSYTFDGWGAFGSIDPTHMGSGCRDGLDGSSDGGVIGTMEETHEFWQKARDNMVSLSGDDEFSRVFIDESRAARSYIGDGEWTNYARGTGFDEGGAQPNPAGDTTWGRLMLTQQSQDYNAWQNGGASGVTGQGSALYTDLTTAGTYFKFADDPSDNVYVTIQEDPVTQNPTPVEYGTSRGYWGYVVANDGTTTSVISSQSTPITYSDTGETYDVAVGCSACTEAHSRCARHSIRFEFRKVNSATGEVLNYGLNPIEFDPRGEIKHDGMSTAGIIVLKKSVSAGSIIVPNENRGVWETEPKKSADLDIYYEASHSIPLKLNRKNIYDFAPLGARVSVERNTEFAGVQSVDLTYVPTGAPYDTAPVTNTHVEGAIVDIISPAVEQGDNKGPLIKINSINADGEEIAHKDNISINDTLVFHHNNGVVTKSKIINKRKSTGELTDTLNFWIYMPSGLGTNTTQILFLDGVGTSANLTNAGVDSGMEVVSAVTIGGTYINLTNTPTFVWNYTGDPSQMEFTDTSWMEAETYYYITLRKSEGYYEIDENVWKYPIELGWHNCFHWGNGVESNRIRDDFNAPQIDNGVKVSTTFLDYKEENRKNGLIYSGIYNSNSGVNDLSEFNMAEKITKDLNPTYGSIQALKTRDTDMVVFTEDKVLKVLGNKDAVYNADGNPQLTATNRVLGQTIPFVGDYGISKNPESLAWDQYRMYFADSQRGAVLRLSRDGLTPISNVGMAAYFRDRLRNNKFLLGNFDVVKGEYNLTMTYNDKRSYKTVAFNESSKGWVSFKSFIPDQGLSVAGKYVTTFDNKIYQHHDSEAPRNNFYGEQYESSFTVLFNDSPSSVKHFKTLNYEGSQARINKFTQGTGSINGEDITIGDGEYYNIFENKNGWYVDKLKTDLQDGYVDEFLNKENKWFNRIKGMATTILNIDTSEFTVQGIGSPNAAPIPTIGTGGLGASTDSDGDGIADADEPTTTGTDTGATGLTTLPTSITLTIQNDPND